MDLSVPENSVDIDDSCDSSSDVIKPDYIEGGNYDSQVESGSESQVDFEVGMRNSASSGLTMKEYEEQLKKLTAENFNLKLRVYFVEERLSKVTGISDKEDLIKKNIQLKITCESQLKELEKKQELLFEASKAFELLQKEHAEKVEKLMKEKEKEVADWEEKFIKLESIYNVIKSKFPALENLNNPDVEIKTFEEYEKQIADLTTALRNEEDRNKELESLVKDVQLELESYELKAERMESEMNQRVNRTEELVDELEQKEHALASANFRVRKLEDDLKSKQIEVEIVKERIEEKNKTIDSLNSSLTSRRDTIVSLENKLAKERSISQSMQSKLDGLSFQNVKLKEELDILQSRLRRTTEALSPRGKGRSAEDEAVKQKYEEQLRVMEDRENQANKRIKELEEKIESNNSDANDYRELLEKHKKLEDDHRKACTALKNFIKRSSDEKKEREFLNNMLSNHEEVIADLKAQLDRYRNNSIPRIIQDDKLSLAETSDDNTNVEPKVPDYKAYYCGKDKPIQNLDTITMKNKEDGKLSPNDKSNNNDEKEGMTKCTYKENNKMKSGENEDALDVIDGLGHNPIRVSYKKDCSAVETLTEKFVTEQLNGELKKRNMCLQEEINRELWEKNREIEKLESRLAEMSEVNCAEIMLLQQEIELRDQQLNVLQNKLQALAGSTDSFAHLECKLLLGVGQGEGFNSVSEEAAADEVNLWSWNNDEEDSPSLRKEVNAKNNLDDSDRTEKSSRNNESFHIDAVKVCSLLSARLEELATFLDSLLQNSALLNGISLKKREDIKNAMERSRELSKHLTLSFTRGNFNDTYFTSNDVENGYESKVSSNGFTSFSQCDETKCKENRDKVISEQSLIINRLRDQLKLLNQEIKQRDIELSRCQGIEKKSFDDDMMNMSDRDGIEKQTLSICQDLSDDFEDEEKDSMTNLDYGENEMVPSMLRPEKVGKKISFSIGRRTASMGGRSRETSESEAWSEPDRSVSLARMGRLDDITPNISHRKVDDSSDSSEETLNEGSKLSGKRCRSAESEIRRLQSKIKALDDINEELRSEIKTLKAVNVTAADSPRLNIKDEDVSLGEKLRMTMDRLDECGATCRQLEEKLAAALQRASASAVQLSKAAETVSSLEQEINLLKEELTLKNEEIKQKNLRIQSLESKIEEMSIEGELKLIEANKQRDAAERKALEVECKLKDAENISKEVESKVNEIEKQMNEAKMLKKKSRTDRMVDTEGEKETGVAEKMMEEAGRIKAEAERKSRDFQNFIDLMRKEVEEKMKEAERRIKRSEKEKEDLEKQVMCLKKKLLEADKNKIEVEKKVKEGKETIQCMEEKLRELEVAMDQCHDDAQRKIKEIQKKAEAKMAELEKRMEERERVIKSELEKKMIEAEKISRELETGFRRQLEEAERRIKKAKEAAEAAIAKAQREFNEQEAELKRKIAEMEVEKKNEMADLLRKLDEAKLEASEFELELTRLTNEKIHLEEELKKVLDKESALAKDNREIKGKYENSIHKLEEKLTQLSLNKCQLASRLEEIESTNIDLVSRISAIRGKETTIMEREFMSTSPTAFSPPRHGSPLSALFGDAASDIDGSKHFLRQGSAASDPGDRPLSILSMEAFAPPPRRHMNSSPDLGIESDPGRFSSLEANQPTGTADPRTTFGLSEPLEVKKLELENAELRRRLTRTRQALEETLTQLSAANQRKKQVERAICKQLHKTHHILRKARVNFESQDGGDSLE